MDAIGIGEIVLLIIQLGFIALGLYIAILVIQALKKYLREDDHHHQHPNTKTSEVSETPDV